jgi:hypothetical protein
MCFKYDLSKPLARLKRVEDVPMFFLKFILEHDVQKQHMCFSKRLLANKLCFCASDKEALSDSFTHNYQMHEVPFHVERELCKDSERPSHVLFGRSKVNR